MSRKSLEAEEVVAHAVVRAGSSSPCPDEHRGEGHQQLRPTCKILNGGFELQS